MESSSLASATNGVTMASLGTGIEIFFGSATSTSVDMVQGGIAVVLVL